MSVDVGEPAGAGSGHPESIPDEPSYLAADRGIRSWLLTRDHKRIALMFYVLILFMLALGGAFALLLRAELISPERDIMGADTYNRMFTLHGLVMIFLFMIPGIPSIFGNFVLPMMLGAKDLAFPRLNLLSLYIYAVGAAVLMVATVWGGVDTGWTFYPPYSTTTPAPTVFVTVLGAFIVGVSSMMTALNFIVTTHTLRAKGMSWSRVPLFVWTLYATGVIIILATPVLGLSLLLVGVDRIYHFGVFDPALGGDPVLFQHLFWFYSHPAVYIMILPAMGVVTETVCTFSHKQPNSYVAIAVASIGIAVVGFFVWGHHMFVAGMSEIDAAIFGVLSMFVGVFSAIKVYTWVATLYRGRIHFNTPMLYFFWFLFLFVFGGMTGVGVATQALDVPWHDTYFVIAHFHFIMVGGTLTAFLSAAHYWFPKMFGRMYSERVGLLTSTAVFIGFVLTFFPQFLLGNRGMPRRYYSYPADFTFLNVLSTGGAFLLAGALFVTLLHLVLALRWGERTGRNPWGSRSFEWETPSPPPKHNFHAPPVIDRGPYDYQLSEEEAHARTAPL
jgi:cytochrome c oxidase subunit 1